MVNNDIENISRTYFELLNQQSFIPETIDYSVFNKHKPVLQSLADNTNCGVSIFDLYLKDHIFYSPNFGNMLGYDLNSIKKEGLYFWEKKIHAEDYISLMHDGISLLKFFFNFSMNEKLNYKLVSEYRILNAYNEYIRVIEQQQILELDCNGNLWLSLSIIDISPNQNISEQHKSQLLNFKTGKIIPFQKEKKTNEIIGIALSKREIQILQMVKDGFLSKEISNNLNISLHTVNTHRQRVLEKLGANNSMEAVVYASKLGLL
jgi:DNA-binding CsgD family transcriptional regulator